jgi:hypothetical protein
MTHRIHTVLEDLSTPAIPRGKILDRFRADSRWYPGV